MIIAIKSKIVFNLIIVLALLIISKIDVFAQDSKKTTFSIYYENNEFSVSSEQQLKIDSILSQIDLSKINSIVVESYSDNLGSSEYNKKLAKRRADNIRNFLPEIDNQEYRAIGQTQFLGKNNRRTDVTINISKKSKVDFSKLKEGDSIILEGILFEGGTDKVLKQSFTTLNKVLSFLLKNENVKVEIIGHICCSTNPSPNYDGMNRRTGKRNLSQSRARAVTQFLIKKGVSYKRIKVIGAAYNHPLGKGDHFDRRVEMKIIKN